METSDPHDTPYGNGITAGHKYFRDGIDHQLWKMPNKSPYTKDSIEDSAWWRGFWHGESDAENIYEYVED